MDGDLYAVKAENGADHHEPSAVIVFDYWTGGDSGSLNKGFRDELEGKPPTICLLLQTMTVAAAILGTCGAAWLGRLFLTPTQALDQIVPDFVALLVFLLAVRFQ